ncbi:diguanylate phosphodiesterase metal dependent hydrolase domain containing protein [Desulfovibrio sp. X2]|uniref:EAL and HDOD domain-containing protein n=1 Tax=Desulfovibrio sp. X2 TaxID=941449 RepID=UPI000358C527|nr:HDOD domain-containing protein [Desulfovibrio sp. X2]EPR38718.1 diguanylate phosphodiesterase metal dependent hydrolase domain containing protein [Desulfovibrio sp. X2]
MSHDHGEITYTPTVFARQPIFDGDERVWGYDLFYRDSPEAEAAVITDGQMATLTVAANAFSHSERAPSRDETRVMLSFTEEAVIEELPLVLPSKSTVVKLREPDVLLPELVEAVRRIRAEGFLVALDDFSAHPGFTPLYRQADILIIDALEKDGFEVKRLLSGAAAFPAKVMAKRVEERSRYETLRKLGVSLYQGFFIQKPTVVPGRKLSSNEASRLNLFRILQRDEPDFNELAALIQTDVSISFRLLSFLNSATFSFPQKVHSIKQAIVILGWNKVRNWLRLIILTDMLPPGKSSELPYLSAIRGKFLEKAGASRSDPAQEPASLFLLGLFSLLDAMFDMPMEEILESLPLETAIADALCGRESPYVLWIDLAKCFESGNWERLDVTMEELGLDPLVVARCYYDSLLWANSFFGFRTET